MSDILIRLSEEELASLIYCVERAKDLLKILGLFEEYHKASNLLEKLEKIKQSLRAIPLGENT